MILNNVWVEVDSGGNPIRIFKNAKEAILSPAWGDNVKKIPRAEAVKSIRSAAYKRAGGRCEKCGAIITWNNGEMDEKVPKGKGGEVSLDNCWMLCYDCHQGVFGHHGNRRWGGRKNL